MADFYDSVLPPSGHYHITRLPPGRKRGARNTWHGSLDELRAAAQAEAGQARVYFRTASYHKPTTAKATNVAFNKALRLDLDAGQAKFDKHKGQGVYRTQRDAWDALVAFSDSTHLLPSFIVSSGEGLHVYYALVLALEPAEWLVLAERLAALCTRHGLLVDPTVTRDITRLLRVPGTMHEGGNPVAIKRDTGKLYSAAELLSLLPEVEPDLRAQVEASHNEFTDADRAVNDDFLEREWPPASAVKITEHCAALRSVAASRGDCPEPLWRAMLGLVKHTVEGDELAHDWSAGYDGYNQAETQKKLDLWRAGPTTCDEFARHCTDCRDCQHRGKIKSPIQLGLLSDREQSALPPEQQTLAPAAPPQPAGMPWDGHLPANSKVEQTEQGWQLRYRLSSAREDEDGQPRTVHTWVPAADTVFWFARWGESIGGEGALAVMRTWFNNRVTQHEMDQVCLASKSKFIEYASSKAVHFAAHARSGDAIYHYAKDAFRMIQLSRRSDLTVIDRYGLRALDTGELVAVHGRYTLHGDGTIQDTMLGSSLRNYREAYSLPLPPGSEYQDCWDASVWDSHILPRARQHAEFLTRFFGADAYASYQIAIMAAIASPLMAFATGEWRGGKLPIMSALNISLYSLAGGYGKTSACQAGVLAYGHPSVLVRGQGNDATTSNYRMKRLAVSGTMPNVMDEMGGLTPAQTYAMLDMVANGSDRGRSRRDGSMMDTTPWALVNLITTNRALQELLRAPGAAKTDAVQRRILEINVGSVPLHSREERDAYAAEYSRVTEECAGALGAVLEREICRLGLDGVHDLMRKGVSQASAFLGAEQGDRFLYRGLGAIIVAATILGRADCLPFRPKIIAAEFKRAYAASLRDIERSSENNSPLNTLNTALNDLLPHTVVTRHENSDLPLSERAPAEIKARHITELNRRYVSVDALRRWITDNSASEQALLSTARQAGVLVPQPCGTTTKRVVRKNLHAGLKTDAHQFIYVYVINTQRLNDMLDSTERPSATVIDLPVKPAGQEPEVPNQAMEK